MATHGKEVLERIHAFKVTAPSDAENHRESVDVVDLLPLPIWHIIFCHLLPPPGSSCSPQLKEQGDSCEDASSRGRDSCLRDLVHLQQQADTLGADCCSAFTTSPLSAREQHGEENARRYGASWPLLRCAMASKGLLDHVISFSELQPISLVFNREDLQWRMMLSLFLKRTGHKSLDLEFNYVVDLHSLGRLMWSAAHSLTSLSLGVKDSSYLDETIHYKLINPAFLRKFGQLQRLKLGRGRWELKSLNAAWFTALRSLTIEHTDSKGYDCNFLSSIAPQLHEFSLSSSSRQPCSLRLELSAARVITLRFEQQSLDVCFSFTPSLMAFSIAAENLQVDCLCSSPLSLDSLTLIGRRKLVVSSLPLASAKTVYLNGPTTLVQPSLPYDEVFDRSSISQKSVTASLLSLSQLLSNIAPTVETLIVRHGSPLEEVHAEWSCLCCLAIGANGRGVGFSYMTTVESAGCAEYWRKRFLLEDNESSSSSSSAEQEIIRPPFLDAPKLESIFFATRQWQPETLASLHCDFPSLNFYCIVGRSFRWEGEAEKRSNEPSVEVRPDRATHSMNQDIVQDDRIMNFLQVL